MEGFEQRRVRSNVKGRKEVEEYENGVQTLGSGIEEVINDNDLGEGCFMGVQQHMSTGRDSV